MEETNGGNPKAQVTHYHWCDRCGAVAPGYREAHQCNDAKFRPCGACLRLMFPETRIVAPWRSAKEQEADGFS